MAWRLLCIHCEYCKQYGDMTMDVPATLNIPIGNTVNSNADSAITSAGHADNKGFSEHFDRNVDRLKSERKEPVESTKPSAGVDKRPKAVADKSVPADSVSANTNASVKDANEQVALPKGLQTVLDDGELLEQAPGLTTAISGIAEKLGIDDVFGIGVEGGNEVPLAADIVPSLASNIPGLTDIDSELGEDAVVLNLNESNKEIVFDPLSQAKESSAHLAALTATNHLPDEKVRFNGKGPSADFFNSSAAPAALEKMGNTDIQALVQDKLGKPMQEVNTAAGLGQEVGSSKALGAKEAALNNAQSLVGLNQQTTMPQAMIDKPAMQIETPMNHSRWGQDFSQRVQWMVNQSVSGAQIRLTPQNMGPIEVRIQMHNDQASISFTAQHGATREAIDAAMPRLREMLNEQNVNVVDVDVSKHSFAEQRDQQQANRQEGEFDQVNTADSDSEESIFDKQNEQGRQQYNGLFSDFA
jgi:flagellar hook-length control protein FliK